MSESSEQSAVITWAGMNEYRFPQLRWLYSSLNGIPIPASKATRARIIGRMKAEGMKAGVPDLFLPVARHGYHGLFIEMKRSDGGVLSELQKEFMQFADENGYLDKVCHGYEEAVESLEWYLKG
jgi:hypothetical protein